MKNLQRSKYYTMNSWNLSTAPAYNLKIYNVIDRDLEDRVYELMETIGFYDDINFLIHEFDEENNYEWQAGFNGRSGGYLVLYRGGRREDGGIFSYPGKGIEEEEVPSEVLKRFRKLAVNIVKTTEEMAKNATIEEKDVCHKEKFLAR